MLDLWVQATVQPDSEKNYDYCVYDSDIATGYGVGALLFLLASQVLVMAVSKCFCCGRALHPGGSRACALILFLTCWYGSRCLSLLLDLSPLPLDLCF